MAICNLCGFSCDLVWPDGKLKSCGLFNTSVCGGYLSTPGNGDGALDDTVAYKFSLCEFCLDWLFERFVIPVEIHNYMTGESLESWLPASQRVKEDFWRKYKSEFYEEYNRRNQAREHWKFPGFKK